MLEIQRKNQRYLYPIALIVGGAAMFSIWFVGVGAFPILRKLALTGLILPIAAGLVGGFLAALIAPKYTVIIAIVAAIIVTSPMLYHLFHRGFSHLGRNPFFWYWPFYVPFSAIFGALIAVKLQRKPID